MKLWVDPPGGWRYGFPKVWDGDGDIFKWLVSEGYPQFEIDTLGEHFFLRQWEAEDGEG